MIVVNGKRIAFVFVVLCVSVFSFLFKKGGQDAVSVSLGPGHFDTK